MKTRGGGRQPPEKGLSLEVSITIKRSENGIIIIMTTEVEMEMIQEATGTREGSEPLK